MSADSKLAKGKQPENPEQDDFFWSPLDDEAPSKSVSTVPLEEEAPPQRQSSGEGLLNAMKAVETGRKFGKLASPQQPMPPLADAPAAPPDHKFLTHFDGPPFDFQQLAQLSDAHVFAEANKGDDQRKDRYLLSDAMVQLHLGPTVAPTTADVGATDNRTIFQMMNDDETLSGMGVVPNNLMSAGAMLLVREFIERLAPAQRLAACNALVIAAIAAVKSALPDNKPPRYDTTSNVEDDEELESRVSVSIIDIVKPILPSVASLDLFLKNRVNRYFGTLSNSQEIDLTQVSAGIHASFVATIDDLIETEALEAELRFREEEAMKPLNARMHSFGDEHIMPITRNISADVFGAEAVEGEDSSSEDGNGGNQRLSGPAKLLHEVDSILVDRYEDNADVAFQVLNLKVALARRQYCINSSLSPS